MTTGETIRRVMELARPTGVARYRAYLERLPAFKLAELLRILEEEKDRVSVGWKPARGGQMRG